MPFDNNGPYASFQNTENFSETKFVTSSSPSSWNDNIETEKGAIFIMEVYQPNTSGPVYYLAQAIIVNSGGTGSVNKFGGNGTYNIHQNRVEGNKVIFGFTCSSPSLKTYIRVHPIKGHVKVL